jgi:hypothetical protein
MLTLAHDVFIVILKLSNLSFFLRLGDDIFLKFSTAVIALNTLFLCSYRCSRIF